MVVLVAGKGELKMTICQEVCMAKSERRFSCFLIEFVEYFRFKIELIECIII